MDTTSHEHFPTLTEREHDLIRKLWRARRESQSTLLEHYREISLALLPDIAARLCCAIDTVPFLYREQLAHAVAAAAIEEHFLSGSLLGELVEGSYFLGGGSVYLEAYGRLCFCSAFRVKHPRPGGQHATDCEELWRAYGNAVNALLALPETSPPHALSNLCLLDTMLGREGKEHEAVPDRSLQSVVAAHLALDEATVHQAWQTLVLPLPDDATAAHMRASLQALQTHMCQFHASLFTRTLVLIVDDAMPASALALFTVELRKWMSVSPFVVGVRWQDAAGWTVVTPALLLVPRREETNRSC